MLHFIKVTLGILAVLKDIYKVRSNRESGDGRYDLAIIPTNYYHFIFLYRALINKS